MAYETEALFREDPYLSTAESSVLAINVGGGIILDRTIFYATSGGQPGDTGYFERADGSRMEIIATQTGETKNEIVHMPADGQPTLQIGEKLTLHLNWQRRYKLMRMHTACHLLSVVCPFPITGAAVGEEESRVDFDLPDPSYTRELVTEKLMELVNANEAISYHWITDNDLLSNPDLIKSKNVRPPIGTGRIRMVAIGENGSIDSQPCGGTHVSQTNEVGEIYIGKIEKKGKENRRFRIRFGTNPQV